MLRNNKLIKWEHFKENLTPESDYDIEIDDELDETEKSFFDEEFAANEKILDLSNKFDFTPFGSFLKKNPLSPYNLYKDNIWVANLYGFNVWDVPNLPERLDQTHGVAVWNNHDPHMIIFAFARGYDSSEVKRNIEISILGKTQDSSNSYYDQNNVIKDLLVYSQQQERDHVISLLPNGQSEEIYENVDEAVKELKNLKKEIKDIIIIRNGKEI
jgi:hypothetical protein